MTSQVFPPLFTLCLFMVGALTLLTRLAIKHLSSKELFLRLWLGRLTLGEPLHPSPGRKSVFPKNSLVVGIGTMTLLARGTVGEVSVLMYAPVSGSLS